MKSLEPFLSHLGTIRDPRRAEGKLNQLPHVLLFSILAIVTGANSYRGICTFIKTHRRRLNRAFTLGWKRAPAHTAIRYILQGLNPEDVEKVFREHAADLNRSEAPAGMRMVALDGKALKGSFDAFNDAKARQILSAFAGPVAGLVGIEGGVVSGVTNLESPGVEVPGRRPRHEECYQQA